MLTDSCGLMLLALLCLVWLAWTWSHRPSFPSQSAAITARVQRLLKPRTPDDCPRCHQQATAAGTPPARRPVPPWRDHKSRRGAPKRIATQGFACPNHMCAYYRITDAQIHALVGDGAHGQCERRETLRSQACNTTFSTRRFSPLGDPALSPKNRISTGCNGAHRAGGRALAFRRRARVWPSARHHHHLGDARRPTQCHAPRPHLSQSPPAPHPVRRTAHAVALPGAYALALGGRRSAQQTHGGAAPGATDPGRGTPRGA